MSLWLMLTAKEQLGTEDKLWSWHYVQ